MSGVLRGRWRIEHQLIRRPHQRHVFDIEHDEFSEDTALNRLFKFTVHRLLRTTIDPTNRSLLLDLREWLAGATTLPEVRGADLEGVRFTRLNDRFRPALNLAKLFLESHIPRLRVGSTELTAFVIDMNLLFERFVAGFLARHLARILPEAWQAGVLRRQMRGESTYLLERLPNGPSEYRVIPDLYLQSSSGQAWVTIDTKYKHLVPGRAGVGPAEADLYQMLAYCNRLGCRIGALIYPSAIQALPPWSEFRSSQANQRVAVGTVNLHRSLERPEGMIHELRYIFDRLHSAYVAEGAQYGAP
jgi:5-methylcytosine-specific restriction enzyme subunit McrC